MLRHEYYDERNNMYVLPCDKFAFDAILFYYQSNGILSRPETVPGDVFREELKISRYYAGLQVFGRAVHDCRDKLRALAMCVLIVVILFSSFMYFAESIGDDRNASKFRSIPDTFWYTIITMVTVGYGDVVPKTMWGKILGSYCALCGVIILYCFPTPIVVVHFNKLYKE